MTHPGSQIIAGITCAGSGITGCGLGGLRNEEDCYPSPDWGIKCEEPGDQQIEIQPGPKIR